MKVEINKLTIVLTRRKIRPLIINVSMKKKVIFSCYWLMTENQIQI